MTAKVFRCKTNQNRYTFTLDEAGHDLPLENCSKGWKFFLSVDIDGSGSIMGAETKDIINGIIRSGYFILEVKINFSDNLNVG